MTKAIRASSCPNHTLGSKPIFLPSKACHLLVSLRHTVFILLPGMLLAYETRDCICSLQEDPLFDTHPSSICQSFFWQGELVCTFLNFSICLQRSGASSWDTSFMRSNVPRYSVRHCSMRFTVSQVSEMALCRKVSTSW